MKHKILNCALAIFLIMGSQCRVAIGQNNLWTIPGSSIYFGEPPYQAQPLPSPPLAPGDDPWFFYDGAMAEHAHNAIADINGEILFFVLDEKVFDGEGRLIGAISIPDGGGTSIKGGVEIAIIPDPSNCDRFFIFTSGRSELDFSFENKIPYYVIVDMSLPNPNFSGVETALGQLVNFDGTMADQYPAVSLATSTSGFIEEPSKQGCMIAATDKKEDGSHFLFLSNGMSVFRYVVDQNGVGYDNYSFPLPFPSFNQQSLRCEMEIIRSAGGGYKMAIPYVYDEPIGINSFLTKYAIYIVELNEGGELISSNTNTLCFEYIEETPFPYLHGLEFSPNAEFLYITHNASTLHPSPIEYFDLNNPQNGVQPLVVVNAQDFESSQIEIGIDGNLYFACDNRIASLSNPNNPASSVWVDNSVSGIVYPANFEGSSAQTAAYKTHSLPDQIDQMDYSGIGFYPHQVVAASATTTWTPQNNPFSNNSAVVRIREELRIESGAEVTIENMQFEFFDNARVIIEPGGRLNLNNTVLTSGPCAEMWLGVEVRGDGNLSQLPTSNQGYLKMINNSRIENAYIGAVAGFRETNQTPEGDPVILPSESSQYSGGIIKAYNSRFRNNQRDVLIWNTTLNPPSPFADNNLSYFDNCDFVVDQKLNKENVNPIVRVQLTALHDRGVTFRNCSFRNTASFEDIIVPLRGGGIRAIDSELSVIGLNESFEPDNHDGLPATENVHQTFYRLRYGVWISGVSGMMPVVRGMEFQDNHRGLFVQDKRRGIYTFNNFYIPANDENYPGQPWGAYFQSTSGFILEENAFIGADNSSNCMGLCVQNQNIYPSNDDVYRNTFENLRIGFQVKGINSNGLSIGLQSRCNHFNNNAVADIILTPNSLWRPEQGVLSGPEGLTNNVFSLDVYNCGIPYEDVSVPQFYGGTGPFTYCCFPDNSTRPNCPQPNMIVDDNSAVVQGVLFSYEDHCPSRYTQNGTVKKHNFSALAAEYEQGIADLESAKHLLAITIDGGETEDVLDILENIHLEESSFLRDLLLARYPLSREVLMAAIESASAFDPWHLTQVLVANSRLPHDVYSFLNTHDVLTPFFMQFVHDAQANNGANIGRLLMAEVSARSHEKADHLRDLLRYFYEYNDSLNTQQWEGFIESQNDDAHKWMKFDLLLSDQNYNGALNMLDSIESMTTVLKDWINFSIQTTTADSIAQSDIDYAWQFMEEDSILIGSAWAWLNKYGQTDSMPHFDETVHPKSFFVENAAKLTQPERFLQAWPNPAKDRVVLTYPREADGMGVVQLFNADGRLVHEFNASDAGFQEISVTGWSPGLYIAKLIVNGKDFETVKISVVR